MVSNLNEKKRLFSERSLNITQVDIDKKDTYPETVS